MNCRELTFEVNGEEGAFEGIVIDLNSLCDCLGQIQDKRKRRGRRYELETVLLSIVLAKLAGEDRLTGIAEWVAHRAELLSEALGWESKSVPHRVTYSRILGYAVDVEEFQHSVSAYFCDCHKGKGKRVVICIDGKVLRGTIRTGETQGQHLLAAFLPDEGWVLMQIEVERTENESTAAVRLLKGLDLRGKIVTGDAAFAQRGLSVQIVEAGAEYVWTVKQNQPQLQEDIAVLFEPPPPTKSGLPCPPMTFPQEGTVGKAHGRIECRTLEASNALRGYLDWPYAQQVFRVKRRVVRLADGKETEEIVYGITSLSEKEATPERLLELVRKHWQIENGLHYRRDETLREDRCHLRIGKAPRMMAEINNLVLGLLLPNGVRNVPRARRSFAAQLESWLRDPIV